MPLPAQVSRVPIDAPHVARVPDQTGEPVALSHPTVLGMSEIDERAFRLTDLRQISAAGARRTRTSTEQIWTRRYRARIGISDTLIASAAVGLAYLFRFGTDASARDLGAVGAFTGYGAIGLLVVAVWLAMLVACRSRDPRVIGVGMLEYRRVGVASMFSFGFLAIVFVVAKIDIARGFFVLTLPLGLFGILLSRWLWRRWLVRQRVRGNYLSRAMVVGSPADIAYVVGQVRRTSGVLYNIVGLAVDSSRAEREPLSHLDVPVVADLQTIAIAAENLGVDAVIVAGQPSEGPTFIRDLSWELEGTATYLVLASRLTDVAGPRIHYRPVEGLPLLHVEIPQFEGGKHVLKRALDIVTAGALLLVLALPMLVIAMIVRTDSPGPALFVQDRIGKDNKRFRMLKFRSMVVTAESDRGALLAANQGSGVLFKLRADPRVTRVGRVLRRYSLDELPQLINVFRGDMSLVGPRPPLPSEVEGYERHVHRRLFIKPGLTGMWQVSGRSDLSWDESVRLDLYYVENWSLTGDLIIMWRTVRVLLRPVGAY